MRVIYIKKSLKHVQCKFKKKKFDFLKKNLFFGISGIFFHRGDPLMSKLSKKFFSFSKISITKLKNDFYGTIQT